ncbi:aminopeptidase P family protein [Helicovermis profundi]|uniref:Aminopeptidase P family protein n=1 Tax=Helicovermis profundi TaxID=3065157 RepID=A0AAU9EFP8_9FIRM|nr:aminopeptidase P family protein [Clostridia bacterium S502]
MVNERVKKLRDIMLKNNLDAYIVYSFDPHSSEYVSERWKGRAWISGFTGSAGTIVVLKDKAGLWTDGRYFIQAEKQLKNSGIDLYKMAIPGFPTYEEWIYDNLDKDAKIGVDGEVLNVKTNKELCETFSKKNIEIKYMDLLNDIWQDRPSIPMNEVYKHEIKYAGKSRQKKIEILREYISKKESDYYIISTLDDIAWTLNLRGSDISYSPVAISYLLISKSKTVLYIHNNKLNNELVSSLKKDKILIKNYDTIFEDLGEISKTDSILINEESINVKIKNSINAKTKNTKNYIAFLKSVKDDIELENQKKCLIRDGASLVRFLHWVDTNVKSETLTEINVNEKLYSIRKDDSKFVDESFASIIGYKEHGALMHYSANEETCYKLKPEGMLLVDSGGLYLDGTSDITRTFSLGEVSDKERTDFTLVLKGVINLTKAVFLEGTIGANLDILARKPMWDNGIDYKCGTGHGIGYFLNVHEGPQRISRDLINVKLEEGMVLSNEPGIYREGQYGIRIENTIVVVPYKESEFGKFYKFETISYAPIDIRLIKSELLTEGEREWINSYHNDVYKKLSPLLNKKENKWLKNMTKEI